MLSLFYFQNFTLKIEDTSLRSMKNNNRTDFISTLQTLIVNIRFNSLITICADGSESLPQIYFAFQTNNFSIKSIKEEILVLRTLSLDAKVRN